MIFKITGGEVLIDDADFELLSGYAWSVNESKSGHKYAYGYVHGAPIRMHRFLCGLSKGAGLVVDHINHDGLDNRRANMRVVTATQNCWNKKPKTGKKYRGVFKQREKYVARGRRNGINYYLGVFATPEEASVQYEAWACGFELVDTALLSAIRERAA